MSEFNIPPKGSRIFFAGLGGIGMSALAQFIRSLGYEVAGSDRDISSTSQAHLFAQLAKQGIQHFIQDGSGVKSFAPDLIVYSSALEDDNPDFLAAPNTERMHRSKAMAAAVAQSGLKAVAVAGSCGKTSVTAWIAATLRAMGQAPVMINGGYSPDLESEVYPGNFGHGDGFVVFEADESDGSLVNFNPEVSLLLNMGDDHHSKDKLEVMFNTFLLNGQKAVVHKSLEYIAKGHDQMMSFLEEGDFTLSQISHNEKGVRFLLNDNEIAVQTSQWGEHSAENALAVISTLSACGFDLEQIVPAMAYFCGVRRRFELKGRVQDVPLYDDYAHNPQKIAACISAAKAIYSGAVLVFFQPHGYGPLGFMREALQRELRAVLNKQDKFVFLPVFYAGGTTSFQPTSAEVAKQYSESGLNVIDLEDRDLTAALLEQEVKNYSCVLVVGARDPSIPLWSNSLTDESL
ncbi:Mur ligase domain-containing protein [Lentisphaera profundi]|uniref:Mur ligase domain-containing protein n=1 Tax=Lentisphaera profundi TaxID=1658616 RepID=A0ABY7VSF2_9BACT|nr:Mur ligase domain-containing protein [Lentisphaera profundi]WDE96826.1 Mur ligase domain-containing protein [Lentisphaera profundi]